MPSLQWIDFLSPAQRQVFDLYYGWDGTEKKYKPEKRLARSQIVEITGKSYPNIHAALLNAIRKLQSDIAPERKKPEHRKSP